MLNPTFQSFVNHEQDLSNASEEQDIGCHFSGDDVLQWA